MLGPTGSLQCRQKLATSKLGLHFLSCPMLKRNYDWGSDTHSFWRFISLCSALLHALSLFSLFLYFLSSSFPLSHVHLPAICSTPLFLSPSPPSSLPLYLPVFGDDVLHRHPPEAVHQLFHGPPAPQLLRHGPQEALVLHRRVVGRPEGEGGAALHDHSVEQTWGRSIYTEWSFEMQAHSIEPLKEVT